jgi:hypothetical protein
MESGQVVMIFEALKHSDETCFARFQSIPVPGARDAGMLMRGLLLDYDLDGEIYSGAIIASDRPLPADQLRSCAHRRSRKGAS